MNLTKKIPQVKGDNTRAYVSSLPAHVQNARKVFHLEIGEKHVDLIKALTTIAKESGLFKAFWGSQVHPSLVLDSKASKEQRDALASMAQLHTAYMIGTRCERLVGITRLNKEVGFIQEIDGKQYSYKFSLRNILLDHLTLSNGNTLIGSIHQHGSDDPFVIIPNEATAESFVMRMNHQLPAFLLNYLPTKEIPQTFVSALVQAACEPALFNDAHLCTWDEANMVVTRPDEAALQAQKAREEQQSLWYKGLLDMHLVSDVRSNNPKQYVAPEARYDFDGEKSVTTVNPSGKLNRGTKAQSHSAKSTGDSDSLGNDDSDSASINASVKPHSVVGFGKNLDLELSSSDSSMEEESSVGSSNESCGSDEGGKGG